MNKLVLSLVVLAMVLAVSMGQEEWKGKWGEEMSAAFKKCHEKYNIPKDELKSMLKTCPTSETGKCFAGCMLNETGFINEKGAFDADEAKKLVTKKCKTPEKLEKVIIAIDECNKEVTSTEICETGSNLCACVRKHNICLFNPCDDKGEEDEKKED